MSLIPSEFEDHMAEVMRLIAKATNCPRRILEGAPETHPALSDAKLWADVVTQRFWTDYGPPRKEEEL